MPWAPPPPTPPTLWLRSPGPGGFSPSLGSGWKDRGYALSVRETTSTATNKLSLYPGCRTPETELLPPAQWEAGET